MRATLFLLINFITLGLFLWLTLSGAALVFCYLILFLLAVVSIGYADTVILFFLGAREVRSSDEPVFFEAAAQEAYKLAVPMPNLYFYNGSLERGFVLQNKQSISLVLNRSLLNNAQPSELSAICFEMLLQVKKGMAGKRTKVMFLLGAKSWIAHFLLGIFTSLIPHKEFRQSCGWVLNYLLHPWLDLMFRLTLGKRYFKKLGNLLAEYPVEGALLKTVGLKLRRAEEVYSVPSRKLMELTSVAKSRHFQNILALELLPHEWDYLFVQERRAKEA